MNKFHKLGLVVPILLAASGCAVNGKVTGGGTMHSAGGEGKAVVAFTASNCQNKDGEDILKGHVTFHDKSAIDFESVGGVDFSGTLKEAFFCTDEDQGDEAPLCGVCDFLQYEVVAEYTSRNAKASGEGEALLCLSDFGSGKGLHGAARVNINTGPYAGYTNYGQLSGNVKSHECPGDKNGKNDEIEE